MIQSKSLTWKSEHQNGKHSEMKVYVPFFGYLASFASFMHRKSAIGNRVSSLFVESRMFCEFLKAALLTDTHRFKLYWPGNLQATFVRRGPISLLETKRKSADICLASIYFRPFTFLFRYYTAITLQLQQPIQNNVSNGLRF